MLLLQHLLNDNFPYITSEVWTFLLNDFLKYLISKIILQTNLFIYSLPRRCKNKVMQIEKFNKDK